MKPNSGFAVVLAAAFAFAACNSSNISAGQNESGAGSGGSAASGGAPNTGGSGGAGLAGGGGTGGTVGADAGGSAGAAGTTNNCPDAPTVVAANQNFPAAVAADNQYVYWLADPDPGSLLWAVIRAPADACNTTPSVFVSPGQIGGLTLNADSVFWFDANGVESRSKAGGPTTLLSKGGGYPLFADATDVFFTSAAGIEKLDLASHQRSLIYSITDTVIALAASAQSVYFITGTTVWRVPRAGGTPTAIATNQLMPSDVVVNATGVYWVDAGNTGVDLFTGGGSVMGMPLAGGAPTALATDLVGPTSIAVDPNDAFSAGHPIETAQIPLLRVPLAGGAPVTLVPALSGDPSAGVVAVNDTAVYYLLRDSVNRVAKSYSP